MSRTGKRIWGVLGVLLALLAMTVLWLLQGGSGARFALGLVPGLSFERLEGGLAGPLQLGGVRYQNAAAGIDLQASELRLDPELLPLLRGRVVLDQFGARGLVLRRTPVPPPADAPPDAPLALPPIEVRAIDLQDATLHGIAADPIVIQSLAGGLQLGGAEVELRELVAVLPQARLAAAGRFDLEQGVGKLDASVVPAVGPQPLAAIGLRMESDGRVANLLLTLPGEGGTLSMRLEDPRGARRFAVDLQTPGLDLAPYGVAGGIPLPPADLQINGDASGASVAGVLTWNGQDYRFDGTQLRWSAERLTLAPLQVEALAGGSLRAEGDIGLAAQDARLAIRASDLALAPVAGPAVGDLRLVSTELQLSGSLLDWTLTGSLQLARDDTALQAELDLAGNAAELAIRRLQLVTRSGDRVLGSLGLSGTLGLAAPYPLALEAQGSEVDPATVLADWSGQLSFDAGISGNAEQLQVELRELGGTLRGARLAGSGQLQVPIGAGLPDGTLQLDWGGNRIELDAPAAAALAVRFALNAPQLLDPRLGGSFSGDARLERDFSTIDLRLQGRDLAFADVRIASVAADYRLGQAADAPVEGRLEVAGLQSGNVQLQRIDLRSSGTVNSHQLELAVAQAAGQLELAAAGGWDGARWSGLLQALRLVPGETAPEGWRGQPWSLAAPAALSAGVDGSASLGQACLAGGSSARLCLDGSHAASGSVLGFELAAFPLELLRPWIEPAGLVAEGTLAGSGRLTLSPDGTPGGTLRIAGERVGLLLLGTEAPKRFELSNLVLALAPDTAGGLAATADVTIKDLGTLRAQSALAGGPATLDVDFDSLAALDDLLPQLARPRGALRGRLQRDGERISGQLALSGFSAELPDAGLKLANGSITLSGASDRIEINGSLESGGGTLTLAGELRPAAGLAGLSLAIGGQRFLAADLPQVRLLVSPQLRLRSVDGELRISGEVEIPEGVIDLERFEPAVTVSGDVVIVDQPLPEPAADTPFRADVTIVLGEAVELRGFGLDGKVSGRLAVRDRPGRPTTARGEVRVSGTYKAYGQDLTIERGRLLFANSAIDNPGLDIRAVRTIGTIKAGVRVRGSATLPELTVYSDPAMDQINTISYIVLGRPASQAGGGASGAALQNAAQALGGNLLAKGIGQKLGLEVGIESSAELGGASAFTVGKFLSPRLFVGYGRSLYEQLQLFIVRYKLGDRYEIEVTSGREQKVGANYRWER